MQKAGLKSVLIKQVRRMASTEDDVL